ncbi:ribonuclease Y [candidate division WWE3 bacterium CG10_big_fil_rev_8_21_14_0_10_32_10]|uniref:Ribonuclease Y n=1 Tax=candidate division WWE3 bacterium CG10_big_fil_rev_8_21_14_0_10_32_10 TaxID=1975090 RepID=A0A2H0R9W2_UNCKA|nr:MAG: ribonuclease Y [candidate division WWE3 bacterium CG10_big_fil_rev_8_21_14_0_10_32_10]
MDIQILITALVAFLVSGTAFYLYYSKKEQNIKIQKVEESKAKSKEILLEAQEEALKIKNNAEEHIKNQEKNLGEKEKNIEIEKEKISFKKEELEKEFKKIDEERMELKQKQEKIQETLDKQLEKLENTANLTKEDAKKVILENVERKLSTQIGKQIRDSEEKLRSEVEEKAKELLVDAMQHGATDYVSEYTVSTVYLPSEDLKGRIIGKDGRNIRAFEEETGVNLDLDESPDTVRISCFDSVRREIAKISLERLVKDGRIHPARIEEVVAKTRAEIEKIMFKEGENLCHKVGIYNLPRDIIQNLGKYKYRYSYGQNMIEHTLEETKIGVKIANEIGADVNVTKLACLLHDIGKVFTEKEGSHIELGEEYLKKFNLPAKVIEAVGEHHEDHPNSIEGIIVQIADSISGGRPGARYEDYDAFAKRMKSLEETANSFDGVDKAFAISAGREVRVIVDAKKLDDALAVKLANDIAEKIQKDHTYPGTVKVTVIREIRATGVAR